MEGNAGNRPHSADAVKTEGANPFETFMSLEPTLSISILVRCRSVLAMEEGLY